MTMTQQIKEIRLRDALLKFFPTLKTYRAGQYHGGHINSTYFVEASDGSSSGRFVLQRVNTHVFPNIEGLMDNVMRISEHLCEKARAENGPDSSRSYLHFIRTSDGAPGFMDEDGFWRAYRHIDGVTCRDQASSPSEARQAAIAFGRFQKMISDLEGPRLSETIPRFHDTRQRYANMIAAKEKDAVGRANGSLDAFDGLMELRDKALTVQRAFENGEIPERVVHNDAKFSNVLLDENDGHSVCVIDLDTCMPGLAPHDFGDLMRSMSASAAEDEPDVTRIVARREMFDALKGGFTASAGDMLTPAETALLAYGGLAMTCEVGVRFLTDHLGGGHYFRVNYPGHNLVRARSQLALARSMLERLPFD